MEWVEGNFDDAEITGVTVRKTKVSVTFRIATIRYKKDLCVQNYKAGDLVDVPNAYFKNHFLCFDDKWLSELVDFSLSIRNFEWTKELQNRIALITKVTV